MLLDDLHTLFGQRADELEHWFLSEEGSRPKPFYSGVDIRNAGYKLAVVDTNLFPAGFNNLCAYSYRLAAEQARAYFDEHHPAVKRILLLPESNTRNPGYISNMARLSEILQSAGFDVKVATLITSAPSSGARLAGLGDDEIHVYPFEISEGRPRVGETLFDAIVLNHDLSGGEPPLLQAAAVPVVPLRALGWHRRRKSTHFDALREVTQRFGAKFGIDPWLLWAESLGVDDINFSEESPALRQAVESVFDTVRDNYRARGINDDPYLYIKHNAGTYGMGIFTIQTPGEVEALSKEVRKRMATGKGGVAITSVLVQEGLPTCDRVHNCVGEPVIYLMNNHIIGGFFRTHCGVDERANLNKPGQVFAHLCSTPSPDQSRDAKCYHDSRYFRVYGVLARLAGLAVMEEAQRMETAA
jgi:glutamate--cysteine ligase